MKNIAEEIKLKIEKLQRSILSSPSPIDLPAEFGLRAAAVAVALPSGCRPPPGPLGYRVAAGWGDTDEEAAMKALLEGAERYSIQYQDGDPPELSPCSAFGATERAVQADRLLLGHPDGPGDANNPDIVTSIGSATGISVDDAALRALLENLEHVAREAWLAGELTGVPVAADGVPGLGQLNDALHTCERRMVLHAMAPARGAVAVLCVNCGRDGAGAVVGSAAATDLATACRHAAVEAAMLWCNMVAMSQRGVVFESMSPPDRQHVARYLQGWPVTALPNEDDLQPPASAAHQFGVPAEPPRNPPSLAQLVEAMRLPCLVFDLTRAEVGLPVARVMLLDEGSNAA